MFQTTRTEYGIEIDADSWEEYVEFLTAEYEKIKSRTLPAQRELGYGDHFIRFSRMHSSNMLVPALGRILTREEVQGMKDELSIAGMTSDEVSEFMDAMAVMGYFFVTMVTLEPNGQNLGHTRSGTAHIHSMWKITPEEYDFLLRDGVINGINVMVFLNDHEKMEVEMPTGETRTLSLNNILTRHVLPDEALSADVEVQIDMVAMEMKRNSTGDVTPTPRKSWKL